MLASLHGAFAMSSFLIISGAVLGGIGILAGTLSAHAIASVCSSPAQARNWEMAHRSWLFHSLVLLVTGALSLAPQASAAGGLLATAGVLFLVGTILFSGCLAAFAVSGQKQSSLRSHRWGALRYSLAGSASSVLVSGSNEKCVALLSKASTLLTRMVGKNVCYCRCDWIKPQCLVQLIFACF